MRHDVKAQLRSSSAHPGNFKSPKSPKLKWSGKGSLELPGLIGLQLVWPQSVQNTSRLPDFAMQVLTWSIKTAWTTKFALRVSPSLESRCEPWGCCSPALYVTSSITG
eukprot:2552248-Amphidinium_carterae.1